MQGGTAIGIAAACTAAVLYEGGYVLQALAARRVPMRRSVHPGLLAGLFGQPLWIGASVLVVGGWGLQLLALSRIPLTLVQPTLALGLVLLFVFAYRFLGESVRPRDIAAVIAIVAGVSGIAWAAPARTAAHAGAVPLAAALCALGAVALLPFALNLRRRAPGPLLVLAAGAGDAWAAFAAKLVVDELSAGSLLRALAWALGAGAAVGIALLCEMTALQRLPATQVGPLVLSMQIAVPVVLAPLVGGERWGNTPGGGLALAASLGVVLAGASLLAASPAVGALAGVPEDDRRGRR
jgi:drug/metabolite transporter (DMT)-like permease